MDIEEEFDSLSLSKGQKSLAWEARAKITWGDRGDEVQDWLVAGGIDYFTAEQIVAIAVRERAMAFRVKGIRDLVIGVLAGLGGLGIGIGTWFVVQLARIAVPINGLALIAVISFITFAYGVHLTWHGLARILGGARVQGAVSDVDD